jgi:16S rRNA (cytosine967-C5)-methyltransferase
VLTDVPCSGSGSWRRDPEGKWRLTPERLEALLRTQGEILDAAAPLVAPGGTLAYATCSLLAAENAAQVAAFLTRAPGWRLGAERRWTPRDGADGFHLALLTRA